MTGSASCIPCQRDAFAIPADVAYLNCAYMSPLSHAVVAAGHAGVARKAEPWTVSAADFFTDTDRVRAKAARLLGGTAGDYAIIPSVSYGIATAAANLPLRAGRQVVVLEDQFPSNVYTWQVQANDAGGEVVTVSRDAARRSNAGCDWTPAIVEAIGEDTAIAALPHCHWTDGSLVDLGTVSARCREVGAALVLDLTQSAGAMPVDVAALDADFAVIGGYKWLTGPYSLGLMYVAPRHQSGRALEQTWIARENSQDFARLVDYRDAYQPGAARFDMGERSNFHLMPMLEAALDQLDGWGIAGIAETLSAMTAQIAAEAAALGFSSEPLERRAGHFLGLRAERGLPDDLVARLATRNVHVSVRGSSIRVTPHLYNNDADVVAFFTALKACLAEG